MNPLRPMPALRPAPVAATMVLLAALASGGVLVPTGRELDVAIRGEGYFEVQGADGGLAYTRDGAWVRTADGGLATRSGLKVRGGAGVLPAEGTVVIAPDGELRLAGDPASRGPRLPLVRFKHPAGLRLVRANLWMETAASGPPMMGVPGQAGWGELVQGCLEEGAASAPPAPQEAAADREGPSPSITEVSATPPGDPASAARRALEETELKELLVTALAPRETDNPGELELRLARPWTPVQVPAGPLTVRVVDLPPAGLSASTLVRFDLLAGATRVGTWQLAFQARLWREVPVARVSLARGQRVRDAEVVMERRDVLTLREPLDPSLLASDQLELAEPLRPGQVLTHRSVRPRPLVRRGGVVEGMAQDGLIEVTLKVEVLEDGLMGQTIRVRNPKTRRELQAKVQNEHTVLLLL